MSLLLYIGKVMAIQGFAFLGYQLLLDRQPIGHWKRIYLLVSLAISFIIPLVVVSFLIESGNTLTVDELNTVPQEILATSLSWWSYPLQYPIFSLLALIYLIGFGYHANRFLNSLGVLKRQIAAATIHTEKGFQFAVLPTSVAPHSFLYWIFYTEGQRPNPILLAHEMAHIREWHSIDRLFVGLMKVVCWFNPLVLLFERAIILNHELLADRAVLKAGYSANEYQMALLHELEQHQISPVLASSINFSSTKKRFKMMHIPVKNQLRNGIIFLATCSIWVALTFLFGQTAYAQAPIANDASKEKEEITISQWLNIDAAEENITFSPNPSFAELLEFKVYNRWGEIVFESDDGSTTPISWDGTMNNGEQAASTTYIYAAKVRRNDGTVNTFTGNIHLKE